MQSLLEIKQKRRNQFSIIASILTSCKECALKTQLMYKANLSFTQANTYIEFLIEKGLIEQSVLDSKECYCITPKGAKFLRKHMELTRMLDEQSKIGKPQDVQLILF